jgi:uncharacterized protein
MTVPAVVSLTTLGVRDVVAATRFYEQLGFPRSSASVEGDVSFFRTAGSILALWGADDLSSDAGAERVVQPGTFRGVALAINVASAGAVDDALAAASSNPVRQPSGAATRVTSPTPTTTTGRSHTTRSGRSAPMDFRCSRSRPQPA